MSIQKLYKSLKYFLECILFSQRLKRTFPIVGILKMQTLYLLLMFGGSTFTWMLPFCAHIIINFFEKMFICFFIIFFFQLMCPSTKYDKERCHGNTATNGQSVTGS